MQEDLQSELKEFFKICFIRLERAESHKGETYLNTDVLGQIIEELADVANYAFLEYIKIQRLRKKINSLT